jgi:hypothetical protein
MLRRTTSWSFPEGREISAGTRLGHRVWSWTCGPRRVWDSRGRKTLPDNQRRNEYTVQRRGGVGVGGGDRELGAEVVEGEGESSSSHLRTDPEAVAGAGDPGAGSHGSEEWEVVGGDLLDADWFACGYPQNQSGPLAGTVPERRSLSGRDRYGRDRIRRHLGGDRVCTSRSPVIQRLSSKEGSRIACHSWNRVRPDWTTCHHPSHRPDRLFRAPSVALDSNLRTTGSSRRRPPCRHQQRWTGALTAGRACTGRRAPRGRSQSPERRIDPNQRLKGNRRRHRPECRRANARRRRNPTRQVRPHRRGAVPRPLRAARRDRRRPTSTRRPSAQRLDGRTQCLTRNSYLTASHESDRHNSLQAIER